MLKATTFMLLALLLAGCAGTEKPPPAAQRTLEEQDPGPGAAWPFWPATMRIHPLTRLATSSTDGRLLEARIEFEDGWGHTTKSFGFLRLELIDGSIRQEQAQPLGWNIDLRHLDVNANHFDEVSRTYLMRLRLDEEVSFADPVLRARFNSLNGIDLDAEARIRR